MQSQELLRAWRASVKDDVKPYLWSDEEAYLFMNDAYNMFVRLTGGIADFRSEYTEVEVVAHDAIAELHPSILRIMSATLRSRRRPLEILNGPDLGTIRVQDYGGYTTLTDLDREGDVVAMVLGQARDRAQLINVPVEDDIIDLVVYRLPVTEITGSGQEFAGVQGIHHYHLAHWMSFRAYDKQDADTFDPRRAEYHKAEFERYCAQAQREWERYKHKNRVVAYGGL